MDIALAPVGPLDTEAAVALFADSMLRTNPPNHTRMRRLAAGVFTARRIAAGTAVGHPAAPEVFGDGLAAAVWA